MLEAILNEIVNEVAFEGKQGCTFDQLFQFVEILAKKSLASTKLLKPVQFDDSYNAYIWSHLQHNDQLLFTKNDLAFDPVDVSYQELKSNASDIIVRSTEEAQDRCIYGSLKSEKKNLTDKHKLILSLVAKSRSQGISQYQIGEILKMDPRTVFYYVKKLDQLGLVVKEEAYAIGMNTRIIILKYFADSKSMDTNSADEKDLNESGVLYRLAEFKENVLKQLREAKDHTLLLLKLVHSLGLETKTQTRWARVRLADFHDQGIIEKFTAFDGTRKRRCVRLPCTEPKETCLSAGTSYTADEETHVRKQHSIFRDLPTDYIFYQEVIAAGEKGMLRQDLIDKYSSVDPVQTQLFFENATIQSNDSELSKYLVYRTEELNGKSRQFRFFSLDGWRTVCKKNKVAFADPRLGKSRKKQEQLVEPTSIDAIGKLFRGHLPPKRKTPDTKCEEKEPKAVKKQKTTIAVRRPVANVPQNTRGPSEPQTPDSVNEVTVTMKNMVARFDFNADLSKNVADTPASVLKKNKKVSSLDNTKARRQAILLDILEKDRIREQGFELYKQFQDIEQATIPGVLKIARTTFGALIQQLHEQQKLRLYSTSFETPFGLREIKTFILHQSLTVESNHVQQFINSYNTSMAAIPMVTGSSKRKRKIFKKVEVDAPLPPLHFNTTSEEQVINDAPENTRKGIWHFHATEYGYLNSKWLRAREFHTALFKYYKNNGENTTVDVGEFLRGMCLRVLMRFSGVLPYHNEILSSYLKVDANQDIPMRDVPDQIKLIIIKRLPQIRRVVSRTITILRALELLEDDTDDNMEGIGMPVAVTLRLTGAVKEYAVNERPLLETIPLNNIDDVRLFWVNLQAYCTQLLDGMTATNDPSDPLAKIAGCRGWTSNTLLKSEEKALLNSFVNFETQTVPSEQDKVLYVYLMRKTGLPVKRIKSYYSSIMVAFKKYKRQVAKRNNRLKKESSNSTSPIINELMQASLQKRKVSATLFKMKQSSPFVEPTFIGSRKFRRLRHVVEPYRGADKPHGKLVRNTHIPFSEVEKDALVHAYSIMKARATNLYFFWQPIAQVITNHTPERCRRVLSGMLANDPNITKTIELLKAKWTKIYERGIVGKEIKDEQPWETMNYDLSSFMEYFITQLQLGESELDETLLGLPSTYKELQKNFHIIHQEAQVANSKVSSKAHSIYVFREDTYDTTAVIQKLDDHLISIELVRTLIKMMLMTPDENYCTKTTYTMFKEFPDTILEQALENLKLEGLIINDRARYGRIPGRKINVSEKFVKFASGILPFGLFKKAKEFYNNIADEKSFSLVNADISSGIMAAALDLISQGEVSLDFIDRMAYIKSKQVLYYPKASAAPVRLAFIYRKMDLVLKKVEPLESFDQTASSQNFQFQHVISTPTAHQIHEHLNSLKTWDRYVYEIVRDSNKQGISWSAIMKKMSRIQDSFSNHDLSNVLQGLLSLKPALIVIVGFTSLRYVAAEFSSAWMLQNSSKGVSIAALMWYDVSGQIILPALEGYSNTVMSYILTQPGITFAHLREKTRGFFTEFELHRLLKHLVDSKKVISKKVQRMSRPKRVSIFDKRSIISVTSSEEVNDGQVSHYWLSHNYYL